MAFQAPNAMQEGRNRKILEQLEEQKKRLRLQTNPAPQGATPPGATTPGNLMPQMPSAQMMAALTDTQHMTPAQRAALQHAHANSVGYFITQDSSFGNLILPVLPRLEPLKVVEASK